MRLLVLFSALLLLPTIPRAQVVDSLTPLNPSPTERPDVGPHHRRVEWVQTVTDAQGQTTTVTNSYVELGTGLNRWDPAAHNWVEARAEFEQTRDGTFIARQTQYQLILNPDLAVEGAVDLLAPDGAEGLRLRSTPMGIALLDAESGQSVMLGEITSGTPEWVAPGEVVIRSAFDGIKASVVYRLSLATFEQDILLEEQIAPEWVADLGLNPLHTRVLVLTEFFDPPEPSPERVGEEPPRLGFGEMRIGPGRAFREAGDAVRVQPTWELLDGRRFLVESVDYPALGPLMDGLPLPEQGRIDGLKSRVRRTAAVVPKRLTPRTAAIDPGPQRMEMEPAARRGWAPRLAASPARRSGVILDYALELNSGQTDYTFGGVQTYYIKAALTLQGTTVFEAGSVLKFAPTNNARLTLKGPISWQGSPYRPVVLTARDDASVGDSVQGASTNLSGYYAAVALDIDRSTNPTPAVLEHFRIAHAQKAITIHGQSGHGFSHGQFVNCQQGLNTTNAEYALCNVLFAQVLTNLTGSSSTARCEHLTVNTANWFKHSVAYLYLTNSLLAGVTNVGTPTVSVGSVTLSSAAGVFQAVGAGSHYLAAASPYRNYAGASPTINPNLARVLRSMTTHPPLVLSNDFTVTTVLWPQAQRDADTLDLGYHYSPLDYCWSGLNLTNATLLLTNGVAVAMYGTKGTVLRSGAKFISEGSPSVLNRLAQYSAVQEQPVVWGLSGSPVGLLELNATSPPEVQLRYTDLSMLAHTTAKRLFLSGLGAQVVSGLALNGCQVRGLSVSVWAYATGMSLGWTNNLFQRCSLYFYQEQIPGYYGFALDAYNNLFVQGNLTFIKKDTRTAWTLKDNLFDSDSLSNSGTYPPTASHNGYRSGLSSLGGSNNKTGLTMDYQGGWATNWFGVLGTFYYPTNGAVGSLTNLIDAGSVASAASRGLYHFTTTTNQLKDATSILDLGYHYVAADLASGNPLDTDGDGLADYFEDRDGDNVLDSGETDWLTSENGTSGTPGLQVFTPME